jgi:antitoxin (DNA-binding transcriptional repressor) of toxin-antitoxin stability system
VEAGEDVVISRAGKPVAKLTSVSAPKRARFGFAKGTIEIVGDVNDPLPEHVLDSFYAPSVLANAVLSRDAGGRGRKGRHPRRRPRR